MYYTEDFSRNKFTPAHFESNGVINLGGRDIPYHTVSEDTVFYDVDGKPLASIFSYSYIRSDVEDSSNRPVVFCFNGGPGASSVYLHAGFLGAKRMVFEETERPTALPPYKVQDNPDCLLDIADVVVIDPISTGYGMLLDESRSSEFYSLEGDAEALLNFIEKWLSKHNRWLSPKYLLGESYGCTRAVNAAGIAVNGGKERSHNIAFSGVILIGSTVSVGKYFNREVPVEPSVIDFPSYAGVHWYHARPTDQTLDEFVMEAKEFADTEYLLALYKGEALVGEEREHIIERICHYTGVTREYLEYRSLKIDQTAFRAEYLKDSGRAVSRYDGRMTRPLLSPQLVEDTKGRPADASSAHWAGYFLSTVLGHIMPSLNVNLDRNYIPQHALNDIWNKEYAKGTTGDMLRMAMNQTPGMRTFFANGYYDLCTRLGIVYYTITHAGLPMDRVYVKNYPSGHMIYIGEENCRNLANDVRSFITGNDPTK